MMKVLPEINQKIFQNHDSANTANDEQNEGPEVSGGQGDSHHQDNVVDLPDRKSYRQIIDT
jgi:hypothetical protein